MTLRLKVRGKLLHVSGTRLGVRVWETTGGMRDQAQVKLRAIEASIAEGSYVPKAVGRRERSSVSCPVYRQFAGVEPFLP